MTCPRCGSVVPGGATFCSQCGAQVGTANAPTVAPPRPVQFAQPVPVMGSPLAPVYQSDKSKLTAGLLQIFLGSFGAGRFYTGHTSMAIGQIAVTWLTCGLGGLWPFIDGIMMLAGKVTDSHGRPLRD